MRHGFPLHRNLRPIFVSFHCNKRDLLTPDAIAYLQRYGPVGCRDWTTVYLLLSCGVPAFFSGCVTTTIDTVFPDAPAPPPAGAPPAYVDMPAERSAGRRDGLRAQRPRGPAALVRRATSATRSTLLETYRTRAPRASSPRACTATCRSGRSASPSSSARTTAPTSASTACSDIDDDAFGAIRDGTARQLERVHAAILAGAPEAEVYALWRELTARRRRRRRGAPRPPRRPPRARPRARRGRGRAVGATVAPRAEPRRRPCTSRVALPKGAGAQLAALVHSLLEHASPAAAPLGARASRATPRRERLAARFPGLALQLGADARAPPAAAAAAAPGAAPGRGPRRRCCRCPRSPRATSPSSPALDLGGHAFAAPRRPGTNGISGFGVLHAAGNRLGDRTEAAAELRRSAHARHRFDFDAFSADVLVPTWRACASAPLLARRATRSGSTTARRCTGSPARTARRARPLGVGADADARAGPGADPLGRRARAGKGVPERATYRRHARARARPRASPPRPASPTRAGSRRTTSSPRRSGATASAGAAGRRRGGQRRADAGKRSSSLPALDRERQRGDRAARRVDPGELAAPRRAARAACRAVDLQGPGELDPRRAAREPREPPGAGLLQPLDGQPHRLHPRPLRPVALGRGDHAAPSPRRKRPASWRRAVSRAAGSSARRARATAAARSPAGPARAVSPAGTRKPSTPSVICSRGPYLMS